MIATDLTKHQKLNSDQKTIEQINFTANVDQPRETAMYFIPDESKQTILDFSKATMKLL